MPAVNLEDLKCLPQEFLERLSKWDDQFKNESFFDKIIGGPAFFQLVQDINTFCLKNSIVGFHYTRCFPDEISTSGLLIRPGRDIRADFMKRFGTIFTEEEREVIQNAWTEYFNPSQSSIRDDRLWFNFTTHALRNGGADLLLKYYGGEQIYFPLFNKPHLAQKLRSIGHPAIVQCTLAPSELRTFIPNPWGSIAASSYHRQVNSAAHQVDQDGYQLVPVPPEKIKVIPFIGNCA